MEKITFSTVLGTAVTIDDVNTSSDADGYIPLHLLSFEGNALGYKNDSSERVGFDGAGFYGAKANIRTITAEIALLPRSGKPATMYELRRKLLRYFPAGVEGTLKYTNSAGKTYQIEGVVSELPAVERQVGVLCTAKVSILSYVPFWRVKADDVELTADAGATQDISFTAGTEEKIPAGLYVRRGYGAVLGADSFYGTGLYHGRDCGGHRKALIIRGWFQRSGKEVSDTGFRGGRSHCRHIHTRRNSCRNVGCDVVLHRK